MRESWAVVTGASSGIGKEYARVLAKTGIHCVLVARREEQLKGLAAELSRDHGINCVIIVKDLSDRSSAQEIYAECSRLGLHVDYLINNAGAGVFEYFNQADLGSIEKMLELNVMAPTILTKLFLQDMIPRGRGYVQFVASIASYLPTPLYAGYGASKAYDRHFATSLNYELRGTGVHCSVINPGFTATEFFEAAGQKNSWSQRLQMMSAKRCAEIAFWSLKKNKASVMAGPLNWFTAHVLCRITPVRLQAWLLQDDLVRSNKIERKR